MLSPFLVHKLLDSPERIDYDILGLHKKRTITLGELVTVEYYLDYDGVNYSNLVVKENRVYNRDANGLAVSRNMTITWYREDGSVGLVKNTVKYYSPQEAIDEGISRRSNLIANTKLYVLSQVGLVNGQDFLGSVTNEVTLFVNGAPQPLRDAVTATTKPYMTPTIIATTVAILTY